MTISNYITVFAMAILTLLILVQTRGATLGAGLGSSGEINTTRRGADKTLFYLTIFFALAFVISLLVGLLNKK
jgi:protein translocase SecG subunit